MPLLLFSVFEWSFFLEKLKRLKTIGRDIFFSKSESFDKNKVSNVSVVKSNIKDERIDKKLLPKTKAY